MTKYTPNKSMIIVLLVILVVVTALFLFKSQIQKPEDYSYPPEPVVSAPSQAAPEASLVAAQELLVGTFPPGSKPVDVSVEGVKGTKTITASWGSSNLDAFYLILFDAELYLTRSEKMIVWAASSLKQGSLPDNGIVTKEDTTSIIPSGHKLGQAVSGLKNSPDELSGGLELSVGRKYLLQIAGFTKEGNVVHVNKEFTYTSSCLPPNCQ